MKKRFFIMYCHRHYLEDTGGNQLNPLVYLQYEGTERFKRP